MTYTPGTWTCDGCGQLVAEQEVVTLIVRAAALVKDYKGGWISHYHLPCWHTVNPDVCDAARPEFDDDDPATLESIPTISRHEIREIRAAHRLPDGRRFGQPDDELRAVLERVAHRCVYALPRAGFCTLGEVARMSDEQLLAIRGVGEKTVRALRDAIAQHEATR